MFLSKILKDWRFINSYSLTQHLNSVLHSSLSSASSHNQSNSYHTLLLSSCKNLSSLLQIHARIFVFGFKDGNSVNTQLINTYSLFKRCDDARSVFDSLANPSVLQWNSVIKAYTRSNQHEQALKMYNYMLEKSVKPDKYTFTFVLKACTGVFDLQNDVMIHHQIVNAGLESDVFISTGLVDMYCKLGNLSCAREVFDKMPVKDVVAWNAMIAGLSQSLDPGEAMELFRTMQMSGGVEPNSVSLLNLFPAVSKLSDVRSCKCIDAYVLRRGFPTSVSNGLIDMYSKCGYADLAYRIFYQMQDKDEISWGTIMAGFAHNGCFNDVLKLFDEMKRDNVKMNVVSAVSALLAASDMRDLQKGIEIHECTIRHRIDCNILVATPLMTMYAKCGDVDTVKVLFKNLKGKDLIAWSAVLAAFAQSGYPEEAVSVFRDMQYENLKPNKITLVSILPSCAELSSPKLGKSLHCYAIKSDLGYDVSTGTALVLMYAKCDLFTYAVRVFDKMPQRDIVTWNSLINGYAQIRDAYSAIRIFHQLLLSGCNPDSGTMVGVIPACALIGHLGQGTSIHAKVIKFGFESDSYVINALIDMYAKCGNLSSAEYMFRETDFVKDQVSWNVMIAVYMYSGRAKEAINMFTRMKIDGFKPNLVTMVSILPAAANSASQKEGSKLHAYIVQIGLDCYTLVNNSLLDMYAKCGRLDYAEKIFDDVADKDTVTWNVMLAGYASHGLVSM